MVQLVYGPDFDGLFLVAAPCKLCIAPGPPVASGGRSAEGLVSTKALAVVQPRTASTATATAARTGELGRTPGLDRPQRWLLVGGFAVCVGCAVLFPNWSKKVWRQAKERNPCSQIK